MTSNFNKLTLTETHISSDLIDFKMDGPSAFRVPNHCLLSKQERESNSSYYDREFLLGAGAGILAPVGRPFIDSNHPEAPKCVDNVARNGSFPLRPYCRSI
ncbi:hypothetical protein CEXT_49441 [Caerostris extrusa]|uniref:Uncharacterized protein n=1 Tax=Caerostris extrusa TaxID=172846 RepID=A0AAV4XPQ5_CAEEX|nr:hypothetical protein CEXT_49441 [Caerostris extrusa]